MPIVSLHQAHFILRSALLSDWMNNPFEGVEGRTPNEVIESEGVKPIIKRISEILHIDPENPILEELSAPFPLELDRERDNDELVFEALIGRLGRLMARSWYEQSLNVFQGRTAKEVLRIEGGEEVVVDQIRRLAIDLLAKPTCVPGEYGVRYEYEALN